MLKQLRKEARKQGYLIHKKRGEDRYMIIDGYGNYVVSGCECGIGYELTLQDVKDFLQSRA